MALYDNDVFFSGYEELRADPLSYNDLLEQPFMKELIGDPAGLRVIDLGCGWGGLCRWFIENGAEGVVGIDASEKMLDRARIENNIDGIEYNKCDFADLDQLERGVFDLAVSSLAFHYVENFDKLFADVRRLLVDGGCLVFSMEHPICTANIDDDADKWVRDEEGHRISFKLDHYPLEGERQVNWLDTTFTKYHHRFSTVMNALTGAGFEIVQVEEPSATNAMAKTDRRYEKELHRPVYLIVKAKAKGRLW